MLTNKENHRKVQDKRHQKLCDLLHINGWLPEETIVTFGKSSFDIERYLLYVPEKGITLEDNGTKVTKTKIELRARRRGQSSVGLSYLSTLGSSVGRLVSSSTLSVERTYPSALERSR